MRHAPQHGLAGPARCRHRPCPAMSHRPERPPSLPIYQHPELATHAPPACCPLMPQPEGAETNGSQQPAWASQLTAPPPLPRLAPPPLPHPTNQPMPVAMPSLAQQQSAIATLTTSVALHCHSCGAQLGRHAGQRGWHRPRCRCRCHPTCHGPSPPAATRPAHSPAICRTRICGHSQQLQQSVQGSSHHGLAGWPGRSTAAPPHRRHRTACQPSSGQPCTAAVCHPRHHQPRQACLLLACHSQEEGGNDATMCWAGMPVTGAGTAATPAAAAATLPAKSPPLPPATRPQQPTHNHAMPWPAPAPCHGQRQPHSHATTGAGGSTFDPAPPAHQPINCPALPPATAAAPASPGPPGPLLLPPGGRGSPLAEPKGGGEVQQGEADRVEFGGPGSTAGQVGFGCCFSSRAAQPATSRGE